MVHLPVPLIFEGIFLFQMILLIPGDFSFPVSPSSLFPLLIPLPPVPPREVLLGFSTEISNRWDSSMESSMLLHRSLPPLFLPSGGLAALACGMVCVCLSGTGLPSYKQGIFLATSLRKVCERGRHFGLRTISSMILFTAAEAY